MNRYTMDSICGYVGAMEQLADVRMSELLEGNGRGNRVIRFTNGSGLDFTAIPDRGMDIVECSFLGVPIAFRSPVGHMSPTRHEPQGQGWLRTWSGGLLTTCGLRNVGRPDGEFGQHGRVSHLSAEDVGIRRGWQGGRYVLSAAGTMRESAMFGEYLELRRSIFTAWGENAITIEDELSNHSARSERFLILYHCNLGYPLVAPGLIFEQREHKVEPIGKTEAQPCSRWHELDPPEPDRSEECFFHRLPSQDGVASFSVFHPDVGVGVRIVYETAHLPNFVMWKNCLANSYALGLEPTNAGMRGRGADLEHGDGGILLPGETISLRLRIEFTRCTNFSTDNSLKDNDLGIRSFRL